MASVSESCNAVHDNFLASQDKVGLMPAFYQDPDKKYQEKVDALLRAWETLASYTDQSSPRDNVDYLTENLYRDTLMLVLRGEWKKIPQANKTHLNVTLQNTISNLSNTPAYSLCQHVIRVVNNPWNDPTLEKIIDGESISDSEGLEFCLAEMPTLLTIRLDRLCDDKCRDIALRLVAVYRKCLQDSSDSRFLDSCAVSFQEQWLDLHVALLYSFKKKEEVIAILKQLSLEDGYNLVQRLIDKAPSQGQAQSSGSSGINRIWRHHSLKTAEFSSQCLLTTALIICPPPNCLSSLAIQLVNLQKRIGNSNQAVIEMLHTLVDQNKFMTSAHMYILCATLSDEFRDDLKSFCIELYVRAVAVDLNDLENRKLNPEGGGVKSGEIGLAAVFSKLAELVRVNVRICREIALTAFSLHPTKERFDKLVELAALTLEQGLKLETVAAIGEGPSSSITITDYNQAIMEHGRGAVVGEPPPGSGGGPGGGFTNGGRSREENESLNLTFTSVKEALEDADSGVDLSDITTNGIGEQEIRSPSTLSQEEETQSPYSDSAADTLGVSKAVINDLASVVHSVRWDVLTWKIGWEQLKPLCRRYMADQENMRSVTKELLFLKIDYNRFKDMPRPERDEFWGIEKGYENCVDPVIEIEERSRSRVKSEAKRQKSKNSSRQASGSSSPYANEQADRKKVLKKKTWMRKVTLSLKTSSDSDSSIGFSQSIVSTETKSVPEGVKRSARIKASKKTTFGPRGSPLVKRLREIRPDFGNVNQWQDPSCPMTQTTRSPICDVADLSSNNVVQQHLQLSRCPSSSSSTSSSPCHIAADHFAPMLSTLDMQPKVILTRTPVKSPGPSPNKRPHSASKMFPGIDTPLGCRVFLEKLGKVHPGVERTMTNLKGLDNVQVRPPPTAVHMVQLRNLPANSRIGTNGLPGSTEGNGGANVNNNNNGNVPSDHRQEQQQQHHQQQQQQQQQQQEETNKAGTSSASSSSPGSEDTPAYTSTSSVQITAAPSGGGSASVRNDTDPDPVTLVSTPSVSIFQVAHRPVGNSSGAVLQPVAAVTGFNPPNPRVKTPAASTATRLPKRSRNAASVVRPCLDDLPSVTLSQMLAQSPSIDSTEATSPLTQPVAISNGPNQTSGTTSAATKPTSQSGTTRSSRGQRSRGEPSIPPSPGDGTLVSSTVSVPNNSPLPSDISSPCRVPLVKYVDLDMVSSPSRPRPGSTTGVRRHSQGSNSNSPDPHRSNTAKSHRGAAAGQNPSSPAMSSPQSPALQAPPSPLSFRKQQHHHVYRQQENKAVTGDRLASPSHPSQCSSPFSRPSSRSQDTSPSPSSEVLGGSMYPPGFLPYGPSGDTGSNSNHPGTSPSPGASASASRLSNFGGASPSQSNAPNFPSALPKFGQAFAKKSHFDVMPVLGSMSSPPAAAMTTNASLPTVSSLQDPNLQVGRMINSNLGGSSFGDSSRRFAGEQHNPSDEEGLGSKLHSLLESALNGQISRSPTRGLPQTQQLVTGNPEMLLSDSAHSISPLVGGMDSQSGSDMAGSGGSLSEQLREFESVFERVAASTGGSHLQNQPDPWSDLAHPDDGSYMGVGPVEFLAPSSTFSESMDVSEASPTSPNSADGPLSSQPDDGGSATAVPTNGKAAPLMQLLTVASAARQALEDEEKENETTAQSPVASVEVKVEPIMEEIISDETDENNVNQDGKLTENQTHLPVLFPTTRVVSLSTVFSGSIVVSTTEAGQSSVTSSTRSITPTTISVKTEASGKNHRNKTVQKSSPVVSPTASGNTTPSKTTPVASTSATASSASPAANKAPQKAHDDEHTVLRVQAILEEYKEQLRNSPDLQNKPAPRRRSNPLPSPNATPKRRKSVQSKVKLLSHHARPAEATSDGTPNASSSADSTPSALAEQLSASSNADSASITIPAVESVKSEPATATTTATTTATAGVVKAEAQKTEGTTSVQVLSASAGIQLSIPVSAVVTSRTTALTITNDGTANATTATPSVGATTVTVSSAATPLTSLTGVSTVPIGMLHQQLLVQSGTGGVRQLLFPLNFSSSRGGASTPRYIQVRQVTMSGQPGVLSFPARFGAPITMRAVAHTAVNVTQPGQQQIQQAQEQTVTAVKPAVTGDTHVILSSEIPVATQPVPKSSTGVTGPQRTTPFSAELETPTTCSALNVTPKSEPISIAAVPVAASTTTSVLRLVPQCVPTVNRVSLPVPAGIDTNALLATTVTVNRTTATPTPTPPLTMAPVPADPPVVATAVIEETDHSKWNDQGTPSGSRNSVDGSVTPAADEKLLNDAETGVSEFLPCADFMGPGVSPSPCFSLSDSPLGSQNSSPATSPATFQASSTEEDSNGLVTPGDGDLPPPGGNSRKLSKSKILKRNVKPRMVLVRKDHGGMEYRRMSDGEGGPAVIRNDRRTLGKRLASKQVAVAAAAVAAATISTSSSSPVQPESRTCSPCAPSPISLQPISDDSEPARTVVQAVRLVIKKEGDISVVTSKSMSTTPSKQTELVVVELAETGQQNQNDASSTSADRTSSDVSIKEEPANEEDSNINAVSTETLMEMEEYIVRPRRCGRLQKEEVLNQHDPDVCPLSERGTTKRRSSVRTNVKKNCPCCVSVSEGRKRTKSEPPGMDNASPEHTSPAKKALISTATSCAAAAGVVSTAASTTTVSTSAPTLATNRPKTTKKYAQRKR
ncbi:mucin-17-like isoform X4 [Daphnia pulicaria]|uniref:mucin-17-like isoform X4 n=1 Tax=Daphnia pulicaria TaxID=35523 RepID=UPI001EEB9990|nr:mucin-17-like isoform X4 [Daphnia pulicaria]